MVLDSFRSLLVVPHFSKYMDVLIKKVYVSRGVPRKFYGWRKTGKIMSQLLC